MSNYVLKFAIHELPRPAKKILERGYQIDDDPDHLWIDIGSLEDGIAEGRFPGVKKFDKTWWKLMAFSGKMEKEMKAFWKKFPDGEVEWSW
jgi:hypothetical protein